MVSQQASGWFMSLLVAGVVWSAPAHAETATASLHPSCGMPRNFHTVEDGLYRGGKIESRSQLKYLRDAFGVTTVVCLAKDSLGPEGDNEFAWGKELGVKIVKSYLYDVGPKPAQWHVIRQAMQDKHAYVHCKWGADRTGAVVAKYREELEGWDARKAFAEARHYGFNPRLKALRHWVGAPDDMK